MVSEKGGGEVHMETEQATTDEAAISSQSLECGNREAV